MSHKMHFPQYLSDNTCVGVTAKHERNTFLSKRGKTGVQIQSIWLCCASLSFCKSVTLYGTLLMLLWLIDNNSTPTDQTNMAIPGNASD